MAPKQLVTQPVCLHVLPPPPPSHLSPCGGEIVNCKKDGGELPAHKQYRFRKKAIHSPLQRLANRYIDRRVNASQSTRNDDRTPYGRQYNGPHQVFKKTGAAARCSWAPLTCKGCR